MASVDPIVFDVQQVEAIRLTLKPGDKVVLTTQHHLRPDVRAAFAKQAQECLGCPVVVLPPGVGIVVLEQEGVQPDAVVTQG